MLKMSTEIFVCTHKKFKYGLPFGYRILQVGASLNADLGYLRDDNGENISMKNHNYCELTGLYWVWKNVTSDYVGLVHYRRYFYKSRIAAVANDPLSVAYIEKQLKYYDIILPKKFKYNNTMREIYERDHNIKDLLLLRDILKIKYPKYIPAFDEMCMSREAYLYNMFCCKRELIDEYCTWLFDLLFELEKHVDISSYDRYNQRIYGFLSERLFNVWLIFHKYRVKECYVYNIEADSMFGQAIRYPLHCYLKKIFS